MTEFSLDTIARALGVLAILVVAAARIRRYVPVLRSLFVPNAVTAGFVALLLGPQALGKFWDDGRMSEGLFGDEVTAVWAELPGLLINVVFAAILLGKTLPSLRTIWERSAPQALFGATLSFGQYAFGLLLAVAILVPVFDMSELSGGLLEISFTGGHGTAAGLSGVMAENDFAEGTDLALGLATVGLLAGILVGTLLVNRAVRSDSIVIARETTVVADERGDVDRIDRHVESEADEPDPATSPLTTTIGVITLAIFLGWLLQELLVLGERALTGDSRDDTFVDGLPLFPFTIIGGAVMQISMTIRGWSHLVPRNLVNQAAGVALDLLIAAAIATLSLSTIGDNAVPFILMILVALGWSIVAVVMLAPRFYGEHWFEPAIGDFGQSSGTVASGFLLVDMSDPAKISDARDNYGYKQLLFEPFLGGGLITALSIPIIAEVGATWSLVGASALTLLMIVLGTRMRRGPGP